MPCPRAGLTSAAALHLTAAHHPPQSPTTDICRPQAQPGPCPSSCPPLSPRNPAPFPSSPPHHAGWALDSWGSSRHLAPTDHSTQARRPCVGCGGTRVAFLGVQATPTPRHPSPLPACGAGAQQRRPGVPPSPSLEPWARSTRAKAPGVGWRPSWAEREGDPGWGGSREARPRGGGEHVLSAKSELASIAECQPGSPRVP